MHHGKFMIASAIAALGYVSSVAATDTANNGVKKMENSLKIGWGKRDITFTEPVGLPGQFYLRVSMGAIDPVTVTALAITTDTDAVIFLSADLVAARNFLLDEIRRRTHAADPSIPVEKILMNVTHTHAGPDHYVDAKLPSSAAPAAEARQCPEDVPHTDSNAARDFIATRAAEAVVAAWQTRAPGGVAWGYGHAVTGYSRRVVYFDDVSRRPTALARPGIAVNGHGVMYGNTDDEQFSHYEAGTDSFIRLLYTFDAANKLTGALVNVPCPSQCCEGEWRQSADFWHDVRTLLQAKYGAINLLPQTAAAGDLSPHILQDKKAQRRRFQLKYDMAAWQRDIVRPAYWHSTAQDADAEAFAMRMAQRRDIAERIASAFTEVLEWAQKDIRSALPLRHTTLNLELSRRMITAEEYEREKKQLAELEKCAFQTDGDAWKRMVFNSELTAKRNRCQRIIASYEQQSSQPKFPTQAQIVRLGDIAFASNQFELYMDYMHRIQARSPFEQTFIVQLAAQPGAGNGGYLATERAAQNRGYSASLYCNQVSPAGGQELVEATVKALKELADH